MGTLRKLKLKMKLDKTLRHTLIKGLKNEILIDLDGDKEADIALLDTNKDGDIDTIALDLDGDGELGFYAVDQDHNGIVDTLLCDVDGDGKLDCLASGKEVEEAIISALILVNEALKEGEYIASELDKALDELEKEIKKSRKELKKLK